MGLFRLETKLKNLKVYCVTVVVLVVVLFNPSVVVVVSVVLLVVEAVWSELSTGVALFPLYQTIPPIIKMMTTAAMT